MPLMLKQYSRNQNLIHRELVCSMKDNIDIPQRILTPLYYFSLTYNTCSFISWTPKKYKLIFHRKLLEYKQKNSTGRGLPWGSYMLTSTQGSYSIKRKKKSCNCRYLQCNICSHFIMILSTAQKNFGSTSSQATWWSYTSKLLL